MINELIKIDDDYVINISDSIMKKLELNVGDEVHIEEKNGCLVCTPIRIFTDVFNALEIEDK